MVDLVDKNVNTPKDGAATAAGQPCADTPVLTASKGEKIFNWVTYKGLNYWTNLVSSIAISDYFQNGKGRQRLDRWINRVAKGIDAAEIAHASTVYKQSKVAVETATILSGGWLLLIPLKLMEDNKRPIVHWLNKCFGVEQKAADGHALTAQEIYIESEQPKQSWGRVLARRIFASGVVIAAGSTLDHLGADKGKMQDISYRFKGETHHEKIPYGGKERVSDFVVSKVNKGINTLTGGMARMGSNPHSRPQRWMKFAVLDTVFTAVTASIMYMTNGARKKELPGEVTPCQKSASTQQPTCTNKDASCKKFTASIKPKEDVVSRKTEGLSHAGRVELSQDVLVGQAL